MPDRDAVQGRGPAGAGGWLEQACKLIVTIRAGILFVTVVELSQREEAERMVAALRLMMHAATSLMTYNFQRMVLNVAQEEIVRNGSAAERAALRREVRRHLEVAIPA